MWGYTRQNTSCPSYGSHTARIRPSLYGLIRGYLARQPYRPNCPFKARRYGTGTVLRQPVYPYLRLRVLSPIARPRHHPSPSTSAPSLLSPTNHLALTSRSRQIGNAASDLLTNPFPSFTNSRVGSLPTLQLDLVFNPTFLNCFIPLSPQIL